MRIQNCSSDLSGGPIIPMTFPPLAPSSLSSSTLSIPSCDETSSSSSRASNEKFIPTLHAKLRKLILRSVSANITEQDPIIKTIYLGNVVTTWGKGSGCLERPAAALWKNHCQGRASIRMTVMVTPSGLKVETSEHGLTEYWNNRLTWCGVPVDSPKLFCWIYRHEGRKLKQELRCHAVLCNSKDDARMLTGTLKSRLAEALYDFRKEKLQKQNARLSSIINVIYNSSASGNYGQQVNSSQSGSTTSTNSTASQNNYKKERPCPSKLSMIEESDEEEHFLLPELTSYDKVIHHLLQLELKQHNSKYYHLHRHPPPTPSAAIMNHRHHMLNNPIKLTTKASSLESSSDIDTKSNESVESSPNTSPSSSVIDDINQKDSRSNSTGSEEDEFSPENITSNNIKHNNNSLIKSSALIHHHFQQLQRNSSSNSICYEQITCSV